MKVLTASETKKAEEYGNLNGLNNDRLMENAGSAASVIIKNHFALAGKRVVVLTGQGNNGGDGYVVARKLKEYGAKVSVVMAFGLAGTKSSLAMQQRAAAMQIPIIYYYDNAEISEELIDKADIIVDGIFGIGFHGALDNNLQTIVQRANNTKAAKIALDIPSGVICDSGKVLGAAFKADLTVSFIGYKPCHFIAPASDYCGRVLCASIGFELPNDFFAFAEVLSAAEAKKMLPEIPWNANKGTKGTAAIYAGSFGMAGAAFLAAKAAMRSGAGITRLCVAESIYPILASMLPEAVFRPLKEKNGHLCFDSVEYNDLKGIKSVLVGPGIGNNEDTASAVLRLIEAAEVPMVIDADGLNSIANNLDVLAKKKIPVIVTPHPGEMARLLKTDVKTVESNRIGFAKDFSKKYSVITVLKGAYTVIATPEDKCYINTTGCEGMATAGSGDMLSGMITAFLANGCTPEKAAAAAVCLHGEAGERTASRLGVRGMIASDMIEQLPFILN